MKKIFITLLILCFSSVIFCEDFLGIQDFRFGMSKDEVLQKEMQCEEDYSEWDDRDSYGHKLSLRAKKKSFSSHLKYKDEHPHPEWGLSASDFEYNKYNESMKKYKGFYYLGHHWKPSFNFLDDKLYEINLYFSYEDGDSNKKGVADILDIFDSLKMFYDKYQITNFETVYEYKEEIGYDRRYNESKFYKVKYAETTGINEKTKNTITFRHNVLNENSEYLLLGSNSFSLEITFHSDTPEYIEFKNQEEQKKLKQQQEEKLKEEKRKQKIYNGL